LIFGKNAGGRITRKISFQTGNGAAGALANARGPRRIRGLKLTYAGAEALGVEL
jgi:hypothetical protein